MLYALVDIANLLLSVLTWIIIGQVILSWLLAFNVLNVHSGGEMRLGPSDKPGGRF